VPSGGSPEAIPDSDGADRAIDRLAALPIWQRSIVVRATTDACQQPLRRRALQDGKVLYLGFPRLAVYPCFLRLTRWELEAAGADLDAATSEDGAVTHGVPVPFEEMAHIDLVAVASVAVARTGGRTGTGRGEAGLELALLREYGVLDAASAVVGTVHPLGIVDDGALSAAATDAPLHWIVTEDGAWPTGAPVTAPAAGLDWSLIRPDQIDGIPILAQLYRRRAHGSGWPRRTGPQPAHRLPTAVAEERPSWWNAVADRRRGGRHRRSPRSEYRCVHPPDPSRRTRAARWSGPPTRSSTRDWVSTSSPCWAADSCCDRWASGRWGSGSRPAEAQR
jgi:5-formyltetrahydrofolate cyclo-ligase